MAQPFIGEVRLWACNLVPRGWALCDGQLLLITSNSALYSILGTTYGGDGRTTFALPNLQARAAMAAGLGPGLSPRRLGEVMGAPQITLNVSEIPSHNHLVRGIQTTGTSGAPDPTLGMGVEEALTGADSTAYLANNTTPHVAMAAQAFSHSGQSQPHENQQPYLVLKFCIAITGIYPPRGDE